jgi:hypothetical protein
MNEQKVKNVAKGKAPLFRAYRITRRNTTSAGSGKKW